MKFILYIREDCPFCSMAIEELAQRNFDFLVVEVGKCEEILSDLKNAYSWNTVPMVFLQQEATYRLIGGYDSLKAFLSGEENEQRIL